MSGNNAQLTSLNLSISRGWDTQGDSSPGSPGSPGSPSSPTYSARAWSQEPGPELTSKTYMRLRDQDISFASKDDKEDKEDKETTVSSDQSKYLESISKLARILEKSELSRAEEGKLLTKMMKGPVSLRVQQPGGTIKHNTQLWLRYLNTF